MANSERRNKRKFESDEAGRLSIVSLLIDGTEVTRKSQSIPQHLPNPSNHFVEKSLNPWVIKPSPIYKNFAIPNPQIYSPCLLIPHYPISFPYPNQSLLNANVGITSQTDNHGGCGSIFEVVHRFNDSIFEFSPSKLNNLSASSPYQNTNPSGCSTQYFQRDDFVKHCYICNKALEGKDIYMYSDNPFCSGECRYQKYINDYNLKKAGLSV